MKKITIAAGHNRGNNIGARGILFEDDCNKEVVSYLVDILRKRGITVFDVTPYNQPFPNLSAALSAESSAVNKINPDLHICVHFNAFNGAAKGTEVLVKERNSVSFKIAESVLESLVSSLNTVNRGIKIRPELHILRVVRSPVILTEALFIDNAEDVKKYDPYIIAKAIADGVLGKELAIEKNAIMGRSRIPASILAKYLLTKNSSPKTNISAVRFAELFLIEGETEGVRGDIAFCQALHETGFLRFGNLVLPEQNNFCGLGATNNSKVGAGAWFKTPQEGVRAQIQHLKAYATIDPLKNPLVDPRFNLVARGSAANWEDLAGKWAVPGFNSCNHKTLQEALKYGESYGQFIIKLYKEILDLQDKENHSQPSSWAKTAWNWGIDKKITDGSNPRSAMTREMAVQMLYNIFKADQK